MKMFDLRKVESKGGDLVFIEALRDIPFEIKRVYYIYGTKKNIHSELTH